MRNFNPSVENLMKFTPSETAIRTTPASSYTAHNGWFEVNKADSAKNVKVKGAKS
jgi:hypothetical protein